MKTSAKIILPISLIVVTIGIVSIVSSYNNMQNAQKDLSIAKENVIKACTDNKNAVIEASKNAEVASSAQFTQELNYYNSVCGDKTGRLT